MSSRRSFLMQATASGVAASTGAMRVQGSSGENIPAPTASRASYRMPRTDLFISRIGYGCASLVEWDKQPLTAESLTRAELLINTAYENGITLFDLADNYGFHKAETTFGTILRRSPGLRRKIVIQSKCGIVTGDENQVGGVFRVDCSGAHIVQAVEDSLSRLGVDYLDILLLHWPDILVKPEDVASAFDSLHRSGKVRYFGVSNHTASQIDLLQKDVRQPLVTNQIYMSLEHARLLSGGLASIWGDDDVIHDYTELPVTVDYCRKQTIQLQAYSPLRGIALALPRGGGAAESQEMARILTDMATKKTSNPSAIALAWLIHHPANIIPIIGSTKPEHIIENCAADRVTLTNYEWYTLLISSLKSYPRAVT